MTEEEARAIVGSIAGGDAIQRLDQFAALVIAENDHQNLIARSTVASIWSRHILDSLQLLTFAPAGWTCWMDVGTGGGFPGLALAVVDPRPMLLVEPRKRRAEFLARAATAMGLTNVSVEQRRVEMVEAAADIISARAVASIEKLLHATAACATSRTRWLLLRGILDDMEIRDLRGSSTRMFHVEQSLSRPEASVLIVQQSEQR